jgi:hypothetical protein
MAVREGPAWTLAGGIRGQSSTVGLDSSCRRASRSRGGGKQLVEVTDRRGGVMAVVEVTAHRRPGSDGSRQRCAGAWRVGVEEEGRRGRGRGPGRAGSGGRG